MNPFTTVLWGAEGTWKTTIGLSFPKPIFHIETDLGGFERAAWRFSSDTKILRLKSNEPVSGVDFSKWDVVTKPFAIPVQIERLLGAQTAGATSKSTIKFPKRLIGYKECWQNIVLDYVSACQSTACKSVMIDSATQCWSICHNGLLQEKQEIQLASGTKEDSSTFRERLQPVEFPNDRMRSLLYTADSYKKFLILSHYDKDIYGEKFDSEGRKQEYKTGEVTVDGFKGTTQLADIVLRLSLGSRTNLVTSKMETVVNAKIVIKCGLPGMGTLAVNRELLVPSFDGLIALQEQMIQEQKGG